MKKRGFTLIEIIAGMSVMVITSLIGLPAYLNFQGEAKRANEESVIAAVSTGIHTYSVQSAVLGRSPTYPPTLDNAQAYPASAQNPFFTNVLQPPYITSQDWVKLDNAIYQSPCNSIYAYDPASGGFTKLSSYTTIAGKGKFSFMVARTATPISGAWKSANGGLYCMGIGTLRFNFDFQEGGLYRFRVYAINKANGDEPGRTDFHLPTGYSAFILNARIDGSPPSWLGIPASDTNFQSGSFTTNVQPGQRTLTLRWMNDIYTPEEKGDANIQIQNIVIQKL